MTAPATPPTRHPGAPRGPQPLLDAAAPDLDAHLRVNGPLPEHGIGVLIGELQASGLIGRGGAGFPAWRKLAAVAAAEHPVVVCNAVEGEPASAKDLTLLTRSPHLVLDGLRLVARAVGAGEVFLCTSSPAGASSVRAALAQRRERVTVVETPRTFVGGEESALIARLGGGTMVPCGKARPTCQSGVDGRPTLVQNAETLAHIAQIARHGAGWFRQRGTRDEPGTFLATVSGSVAAPGVYEVAHGVPLTAVLAVARPTAPLRAALVGGCHGVWLPATGHVPMSRPGAGVVIALAATSCGLKESAQIAAYLAGQSARQCGLCRNGLPWIASVLGRLADGEWREDLVPQLHRLTALVEGRGACHHPDGVARFVRSTLATFDDEVRLHLSGRCCR